VATPGQVVPAREQLVPCSTEKTTRFRRFPLACDLQCFGRMSSNIADASQPRRIVLRIGIVLSNSLVEELLVSAGTDVTLGTHGRCTLRVPCAGVPARWRLFRWRRGRFALAIHPSMAGRVAWDREVRELTPNAPLSLALGVRGRVVLGEATVLFQLLSLPAIARPRLPRSLRGSPLQNVDRPFALALVLSVAIHSATGLGLRRVGWPGKTEDDVADFHRIFVRRPVALPPARNLRSDVVSVAPRGPTNRAKSSPIKKPAQAGSDIRSQLVDRVGKIGLLAVLTARGQEGALSDLLDSGNVDRLQETALAEVRGVELASADARPGLAWTRGSGTVADVKGMANLGSRIDVATTGMATRDERRVPRVRAEAPTLESGTPGQLDEQLLLREVRGRLGAVRACYERALRRNPSLVGKMVLQATISPAGTVSALELAGGSMDDQEMLGCMRGLILHWRFPSFSGGSVEMSLPFVFQPAL
jgi:hypothetical protein